MSRGGGEEVRGPAPPPLSSPPFLGRLSTLEEPSAPERGGATLTDQKGRVSSGPERPGFAAPWV